MASKFELSNTTPAAPSGRVNVTWQHDVAGNVSAHTASGAQTPWTSDIDAAVFNLNDAGVITFAPYTGLPGPDVGIGNEAGTLHLLADNGGSIDIESIGTGRIMVSTDSIRRIVVHQGGNVGIGPNMNPGFKLDVAGDVNSTGVYRINGNPLSAAQVAGAVSTSGSYADPAWITSLDWAKIANKPVTFAPSAHAHAAADVTSGVFATARLGAGAPSSSVWLRGDGAWAALAAGVTQTPWTQHIDAAGFELRNAGKVGIGTASPTMALHVAGQGFYSSSMQTYDPGDGSGAGTRIGYNQTGDWGYVNASNTGVAGKGLRLQPAGGWVSVGSLGTPVTDSLTLAPILYATSQDNGIRLQTPGGEVQARLALKMDGAGQPSFAIDGPSAVGAYAEAFAIVWMTGGIKLPRLPSSNPGAGTKQLYYDPADGNRVKFAA